MNHPTRQPIPVVIIAGFLGAGKTTLLRDMLPLLRNAVRVPHVILNDVLGAEVDSASLRELVAAIRPISASCICCDALQALVDALAAVPAEPAPMVLIEANGTVDPFPLIEAITLSPSLGERFSPVLQVTVINESRWQKRLLPGDRRIEAAQLRTANFITTNRGERASAKQRLRLATDLARLNPAAARTTPQAFAAFLRDALWDDALPQPAMPDSAVHHHHHAALRVELPRMSETALRQWLLALPREVLRAKGLAVLDDGAMCFFQRTDDEFARPALLRAAAVPDAAPCAVLIGPQLDRAALLASLDSCRGANPSATRIPAIPALPPS